MRISVVIPVYNVSQYIAACLDSVLNQSYQDIQIILINDGSTDGSDSICRAYADKYSSIKYLSQTNMGLSATRNKGIELADGDYILFLDSDDTISESAVDSFVIAVSAESADVIIPDYVYAISESGVKSEYRGIRIMPSTTLSGVDYLAYCMKSNVYNAAACFGMYSRQFLEANKMRFHEGIYHEDELWTPMVMLAAQKVLVIRNPFYNYVQRTGSITKSPLNDKRIIDFSFVLDKLEDMYQEVKPSKQKRILFDYWARQKMTLIMQNDIGGGVLPLDVKTTARQCVKPRISLPTTWLKYMLLVYTPKLYILLNPSLRAVYSKKG